MKSTCPFRAPETSTPDPANVPQWQVSTGGGVFSKWRADGRALFYQSLDGQIMAVPVTMSGERAQLGTPTVVFRASFFGASADINLGRRVRETASRCYRFCGDSVEPVGEGL
jgi:hypothetical protein